MHAIQTAGLTKYYGKARGILDLSLEVAEGEIFGFIGPNGAGKTTTIRTLLGLIRPTSGRAFLFGTPVPTGGGRLYRDVGYLPGEVRYYPEMTGAELLDYAARFYPGADPGWARDLVERLRFDPSRRVRAYSQGNLKKLGIIQALLHRPRLAILDEPTSGLDPLTRLELFQLLKEINEQGTTVFFSTHVLEEVDRLCHRVGVVKEGRLIHASAVEDLPGRRMRLVTLRLSGGAAPGEALAAWGRPAPVEGKPGYHRWAVHEPVNAILARLAELDLEDVSIAAPGIEDLFLAMYQSDGEGGGRPG